MLPNIEISWADLEGMDRFAWAMRTVESQFTFTSIAQRALRRTGDMAYTQVVRALAKQTGLKQKLLRKALVRHRPSFDNLAYRITARGGDISLKYFSPRETRRGVSVRVMGSRRIFDGAFLKGGAFPNRVAVPKFGGHVFERAGKARTPIFKVRSGVVIPEQMVRGTTARAFEKSVATNLPRRFAHELKRATGIAFD